MNKKIHMGQCSYASCLWNMLHWPTWKCLKIKLEYVSIKWSNFQTSNFWTLFNVLSITHCTRTSVVNQTFVMCSLKYTLWHECLVYISHCTHKTHAGNWDLLHLCYSILSDWHCLHWLHVDVRYGVSDVLCMTYLYLCRNKMSTAKRFRPAPTVAQIQTDVLTKVCAWWSSNYDLFTFALMSLLAFEFRSVTWYTG